MTALSTKEYIREIKAVVEIELEKKVDTNSLEWIANLLREHLFRNARRVFMIYFLKTDNTRDIAWATTNFDGSELKVSINDFTE